MSGSLAGKHHESVLALEGDPPAESDCGGIEPMLGWGQPEQIPAPGLFDSRETETPHLDTCCRGVLSLTHQRGGLDCPSRTVLGARSMKQ